MIESTTFKKALLPLLDEAFGVSDAPSGFFLDSGKDGLMGTLDALSVERATATQGDPAQSIAAHAGHLLFLLNLFLAAERGEMPEHPDWEGSWSTVIADEVAWDELRGDLHRRYDEVRAALAAREQWPDIGVGASIMLVAHIAYHVGEIRQRLLWLG